MDNFRKALDLFEGLTDVKGAEPAEKDFARMKSLIKRAKGDEDKMLVLVRNMAKAINKPDKAVRRAKAAMEILPKNIAKTAYVIFTQSA
jgi:hypothetical protein